MTQEELDKDMIESIEMWLHEIEPKWVEKELNWLEELRNRLLEEKSEIPNDHLEVVNNLTSEVPTRAVQLSDGRFVTEELARQMKQTCIYGRKPEERHCEYCSAYCPTGHDFQRTEGLDEAAKNYALNTAEDSEQYSARYLGYKDGAEWQKEQDNKELSEKIASAYQLGLADKEKQMLKEAVEGVVMDFSSNRPRPQVDVLLDPHKYHTGDKVRGLFTSCQDKDTKTKR